MRASVRKVVQTLSRPVPRPLFYKLARRYAQHEYHQFLRERIGDYFVPADFGPAAPHDRLLVTRAMNEEDLRDHELPDRYFAAGIKTVHSWLAMLEPHGFNLRTCGAILEFGCGTGRLIRHFRCISGIRIAGCDVDAAGIEWCKQNIPMIEFHVNELTPPLRFAQDNSFDVIIAASVFTHIPLDVQAEWLREMRRVLRPGGFLVCTVDGHFNQARQLTPENFERLRRDGHLTLTRADENLSLASKAIGSPDVHQTRAEVIRCFGAELRLVDYFFDKQDALILQKPNDLSLVK